MRKENVFKASILAIILCLITVTTACIYYSAYRPEKGLVYTLIENDTAYEVTRCENTRSSRIVIPSKYKGKPVTKIASSAFSDNDRVKTILLPSSIEEIDEYAFYSCEKLEQISLPRSLKSIGESAFYACKSLESIILPVGLKYIGERAFYNCTSLNSIRIPDSVTEINDKAFFGCSSLNDIKMSTNISKFGSKVFDNTAWLSNQYYGIIYIDNILYSVKGPINYNINIQTNCTIIAGSSFMNCDLRSINIPDSVVTIGDSAFLNCFFLDTVIMTDSVTSIGQEAFKNCTSLTDITLSNNVTTIETGTFTNCGIYWITLPSGLTTIKGSAFDGCANLTDITIPEGVTSIEKYAFYDCPKLKSISIPKSLHAIEEQAFYKCDNLTYITVDTQNPIYQSQDNCLIRKSTKTVLLGTNISVIPNGIATINDHAFSYLNFISVITLPQSVVTIKDFAFFGSSISSISMRDNLVSIGFQAFKNCYNLTEIKFSNNLTYVGMSAFENTAWYENQPDGLVCMGNVLYEYKGEMPESNVVDNIPSHIRSISDYAFFGYQSLEKIILPDSMQSIGKNAFYNCKLLKEIVFPNGLKEIGDDAFYYCSSLTEITLPNSLEYLGYGAFYSCTSLNKVVLSNSLEKINPNTFNGCSSLKNITLPTSIEAIGESAFKSSGLQSIIISKNITDIAKGAFLDCREIVVYTDANEDLEGWYHDEYYAIVTYWFPMYYNWIDQDATIIYNCTLSQNNDYVVSIVKSKTNVKNPKSSLVLAPYREGYLFIGWSNAQDSNIQYISAAFSELPLDTTILAMYKKT